MQKLTMSKYLWIFVTAFFVLGVFASSCKKGTTIGAVSNPGDGDRPVFDTLLPPTSKYFFVGKFDGKFFMWEDGLRSKWDTATRQPGPGNDPDDPWDTWPAYSDNIYYNFCEEGIVGPCRYDSANHFYAHRTRFIRPDFPERRLDIYFYACIDTADTNDPNYPSNELSVIHQIANPFTNEKFGRDGVQIVYTDENRDQWVTDPGSGQPHDTYFRITDFYPRDVLTDTLDTFGMYIVEGEFAGRLFHGIQEKVVTEAKFRARLIPRKD